MRAWETFGKQYGFDPAEAAHASHGRRLADTLVEWCKIPKDDLFRLEVIYLISAFTTEFLLIN